MNFDTSYEPEDEEITIILDDSITLKASLGAHNELVLNQAFAELEDDNESLYLILKRMVRDLLKMG